MAVWTSLPARSCHSRAHPASPRVRRVRRPWGLRFRVLAAAGADRGRLADHLRRAPERPLRARASPRSRRARPTTRSRRRACWSGSRWSWRPAPRVRADGRPRSRPYERARARDPGGRRASCWRFETDPASATRPRRRRRARAYAERGVVVDARSPTRRRRRQTDARPGRRSAPQLAAFAADERAEQMRLRAEGTRLRTRATRIAVGGLALLLVLIARARLRAPCARSSARSTVSSASPASSAPAASARACPRPARRRRRSSRTRSTSAPSASQRATERHLAELDAVFRDSPLGHRVPRPRPALPARQRGAGADEPGARRRAPRPHRRRGHRPARVERALREVIETRRAAAATSTSRCTAAASRPATSPVRDDRGELLAVGKAMSDVTARRRAEARARAPAGRDLGAGQRGHRRRRRRGGDRAGRARAGRRGRRPAAARRRALDAGDRHRPGPRRPARAARWGTLPLAERMPATDAARTARRVFISDEADAARALSRPRGHAVPARRARTRRCRWSPTGARSACSRSASRARSRSTTTSAAC